MTPPFDMLQVPNRNAQTPDTRFSHNLGVSHTTQLPKSPTATRRAYVSLPVETDIRGMDVPKIKPARNAEVRFTEGPSCIYGASTDTTAADRSGLSPVVIETDAVR